VLKKKANSCHTTKQAYNKNLKWGIVNNKHKQQRNKQINEQIQYIKSMCRI